MERILAYITPVEGNRPPGTPDNSLPPLPGVPDNSLPEGPPGIWPPLSPSRPVAPAHPWIPPGAIWPPVNKPVDPGYGRPVGGRPDNSLPGSPNRPDNTLPSAPGKPDNSLPGSPNRPDNSLPGTPGTPDNSLPVNTKFWVVVGIPGVGWRYVCVDTSLSPDNSLPGSGGAAQPK